MLQLQLQYSAETFLLSPVMRELENMLQLMRCGMFHPGGMVTPSVMPVVPGTPFAVPPTVPGNPGVTGGHVQACKSLGAEHEPGAAEPHVAEAGDALSVASPSEFGVDQLFGHSEHAAESPDSETTEEDSIQSSSDSEDDDVEDTRPDFLERSQKFYLNEKSLAIHCERTEGVLKCGRRVSPHFVTLCELHGIRCSRCFDI